MFKIVSRRSLNSLRNLRYYSSAEENVCLVNKLDGKDKGIAEIVMNRNPKVLNAMNTPLVQGMIDGLKEFKDDKDVRVVVFRSTSKKAFSCGMDVKEAAGFGSLIHTCRQLIWDIYHFPKPTIAAIDGIVLGGGMETALGCDILVGAENARAGLPESSLGLIPGGSGHYLMTKLVGPNKAKEMIFTAQMYTGKQSYEMGLLQHLVPQNEDGNAAHLKSLEIARKILPNGPISCERSKVVVNKSLCLDFASTFALEFYGYQSLKDTHDAKEGMKAFAEKRPPKFTYE